MKRWRKSLEGSIPWANPRFAPTEEIFIIGIRPLESLIYWSRKSKYRQAPSPATIGSMNSRGAVINFDFTRGLYLFFFVPLIAMLLTVGGQESTFQDKGAGKGLSSPG